MKLLNLLILFLVVVNLPSVLVNLSSVSVNFSLTELSCSLFIPISALFSAIALFSRVFSEVKVLFLLSDALNASDVPWSQ